MDERIKEIEYALLNLEKPSIYLNQLLEKSWFKEEPWSLLFVLSKTEQSPIHHPEGDVWKHTMLVVDEAAKVKHLSNNVRVFMWAALLHDIGKPKTTRNKKGKITAYNHDSVGAPIARDFLQYFFSDSIFIEAVVALVRWHMHILYVNKSLPFGNVKKMLQEVDKKEVALLGWCDRIGRTNADAKEQQEEIKKFYSTVSKLEK